MKTALTQAGAAATIVIPTGGVTTIAFPLGGITGLQARGPQGPPGQAIDAIDRTADVALSGHRVVRGTSPGGADYCDSATPAHAAAFLGLTQGAASSGAAVTIQRTGIIVEPSWSWAPWLCVFVGANGVLTQSAPSSGFSLVLGVAMSATSLLIRPQPPIYL